MDKPEIICSYLKKNSIDYEIKIFNFSNGFYIEKDGERIFKLIKYNNFYKYNNKTLNKLAQIIYLQTEKLYKDYTNKKKCLYYNYKNLELNSDRSIIYNFNKTQIYIKGYKPNKHGQYIYFIVYLIKIKYYNKLRYKYKINTYNFKYKKYRIFIPNKYEIAYNSNYFLILI